MLIPSIFLPSMASVLASTNTTGGLFAHFLPLWSYCSTGGFFGFVSFRRWHVPALPADYLANLTRMFADANGM